jgi:hypothetical protein
MEHLSQFDMTIHYICGEDNTVTDALPRLPDDPSEVESEDIDVTDSPICWDSWLKTVMHCNAVLTISVDKYFLKDIRLGYKTDEFCKKLAEADKSIPGVHCKNKLWYIGD